MSVSEFINGVLSAALGVLADTLGNLTPGATLTLRTLSGNANIILTPNGTGVVSSTGNVAVAAGKSLTADTIAPTSAGGLTISTSANGNLSLSPNGTGVVAVAAGKGLTVDTIAPTSAGGLTISTSANGNLALSPNGTGVVAVAAGKGLTVDTIAPTTAGGLTISTSANGNLALSPNGTGVVAVAAGKILTADTISPTTAGGLTISTSANGNLALSPNGTGAVAVAAGKTFTADTISSTTVNGNLLLSPNGIGVVSLASALQPTAAQNIGAVATPVGTLVGNDVQILNSRILVNSGPNLRTITVPSPAPDATMAVLSVAQVFSAAQTFSVAPIFTAASDQFAIQASGAGNKLIFTATNPATASRTMTFPDPGGNDAIAYLALAQLFSGVKTFSAAPVLTAATNQLAIQAGGAGNKLIFTSANPATSDRTLTYPDPGGNDSAVYLALSQALLAKTVQFPTTGGTPSTLNYYEENVSTSFTWTGGIATTSTIIFSRIGSFVFARITAVTAANAAMATIAAAAGSIPARFRPAATLTYTMVVVNNGLAVLGAVDIGSDGHMTWFVGLPGSNFTTSTCGWTAVSLGWSVV